MILLSPAAKHQPRRAVRDGPRPVRSAVSLGLCARSKAPSQAGPTAATVGDEMSFAHLLTMAFPLTHAGASRACRCSTRTSLLRSLDAASIVTGRDHCHRTRPEHRLVQTRLLAEGGNPCRRKRYIVIEETKRRPKPLVEAVAVQASGRSLDSYPAHASTTRRGPWLRERYIFKPILPEASALRPRRPR